MNNGATSPIPPRPFRIGYRQSRLLEWILGLEAGYADGPPASGIGVLRVLLAPGAALHWVPMDVLDLFAVMELGYVLVAVTGRDGTTDSMVGVGRLRTGARVQISDHLFISGTVGLAAHLITLDRTEDLLIRPELMLTVGL